MFPQFRKLNNESGIVLFIVLMTSIIIMLYGLAVMTQSMNEINYAQQQIDQIASEELSKGMFWKAYSYYTYSGNISQISDGSPGPRVYLTVTDPLPTAQANIYLLNVTTNYDTFN